MLIRIIVVLLVSDRCFIATLHGVVFLAHLGVDVGVVLVSGITRKFEMFVRSNQIIIVSAFLIE